MRVDRVTRFTHLATIIPSFMSCLCVAPHRAAKSTPKEHRTAKLAGQSKGARTDLVRQVSFAVQEPVFTNPCLADTPGLNSVGSHTEISWLVAMVIETAVNQGARKGGLV
jgi:hypothetical protein